MPDHVAIEFEKIQNGWLAKHNWSNSKGMYETKTVYHRKNPAHDPKISKALRMFTAGQDGGSK